MTATAWPALYIEPESFDFFPEDHNVQGISPYSGHRHFSRRYENWRAIATWAAMPASQQLPIMAWLTSSRSGVNSLFLPNFKYRSLIGTAPGTMLALTAGATAGDFFIETDVAGLSVGDFITNNAFGAPRLFQITAATGADYGIWPGLRSTLNIGHQFRHLGSHSYLDIGCTMIPVGGLPQAPAVPSPGDDKIVDPFTIEFVEPLRIGEL